MNVDINSNCKVVSTYFTGNTVMDESLDFQEKKSFKGPKNTKTTAKPKKKKVKQIKGQKDIRTALKPKKNDLIAYSKDFDLVCKKSGIDVDSEQLQLAIALSKSLQHSQSDDGPSTSTLTTQQRTGLICSTLKEYGFKVPEVKSNVGKKNKKRRKLYRLLLTTDEEKQQIISDKYSQLLFELSSCKSIISNNINLCLSELFIYNMSTNIEYKDIKKDDVFYVNDLIEKSPNTMGCLLKKWSSIPGRLQSPTQDKSETIFSEIECSQDEIDIVLSGSLKSSKDILKKRNFYRRKSINCSIIDEHTDKTDHGTDAITIEKCPTFEIVSRGEDNSETKKRAIEIIDVPDKQLSTVPQPSRSLSPDLFDDDEDTIVETNDTPVKFVSNVITESSDVTDLTECVNVVSQKCINISRNIKPSSQLSQEIDLTKRKSNDFMEMTECIGGSSQPMLERIDDHIDLTEHDDNVVTEKDSTSVDHVEHMDLTQSSTSSTDTLPFVLISGKDPVPDKSLDDTIILNENDYLDVNSPIVNTEAIDADIVDYNDFGDKLENINGESINGMDKAINVKSPVNRLVEVKEASIICLDETCEVGAVNDNIDLTQTSDANAEEVEDVPNTTPTKIRVNNSSLGKKDNVSVDYDEALENMNSNSYRAYDNFDSESITELRSNLEKSSKENMINKSKHSEVLELSDNEENIENNTEVDIHFDLGGISVMDHFPSFSSNTRNTIDNIPNGSMSENLPMVDIKGKKSPPMSISPLKEYPDPISDAMNVRELKTNGKTSSQTPKKGADEHLNIETPKQSEYIVKTDNVTPMLDYAAMTSPERNKELDKYGLKPFKRKRAIQLLTHLYNQTHPYVESTEDLPSPSKKRKCESLSQPSTSEFRKTSNTQMKAKSQSPPKVLANSVALNVSDKEIDMFMVTNESPVIKHLECDAEDWVFQKREKAKLHTCRVPLHVAFHNFVSCRVRLQEAILRYEPVSIDVIHKELAASGHRYDPKDLLKFMDKKCITVKTADSVKNKNRY